MKFRQGDKVQFTYEECGMLKGKIHCFLKGKWIVVLDKPLGNSVSLAIDEDKLIETPF